MKLAWLIILLAIFPGASRAETKTPRDFSISLKPFNLSYFSLPPILDLKSAQDSVSKLKSLRLSSLLTRTPLTASLVSRLGIVSVTGGWRGLSYTLAGGYRVRGTSVSLNIRNIARSPLVRGTPRASGNPMAALIAVKGGGASAAINAGLTGMGDSTFDYSKHGLSVNLSRINGKVATQAFISEKSSSVSLVKGNLEFTGRNVSFGSHGITSLNIAHSKSLNISGSSIGQAAHQMRLDYIADGFAFHAREGLAQGMDITLPTFHGANMFLHGIGGANQGLDFHAPVKFFNIQGLNVGGIGETFSMAGILPMTTKFLITRVMNGTAAGTSMTMTSGLGLRNASFSVNSNTATRTRLLNFSLPIFEGFKFDGQYSSGITSSRLLSLLGGLGRTGSLSMLIRQIGMSSTSTLGFAEKWEGLNWSLSYSRIKNPGTYDESISGGFSGNLSKVTTLSVNCERGLPSYRSSGWNTDTISFSNKINATNFITLSSTYNDSPGGASSVNLSYKTEWR